MRPCCCCCCCCCSFFRPRQPECSFSSPPCPGRPGCCARWLSARQWQEAVPGLRSGQVGSSPGSCRREQPRTAARHSAVWWPAPGFPSCLPPTHLDIILQTTRYLQGTYLALPTGAARLHNRSTCRRIFIVSSAIEYMTLDRHPKSVSVYEGTGRWLAPGEMKMGTSLDSPLCMRHDDRWRVGSAQSVPLLGFQASLLSGAPRPSPRPCSPSMCAVHWLPRPSPPCHATLTAPSVLLLIIQSRWTL